MLTILNVIYVLLAIAMIGFILVQRGAGAQAGSGFGAGASATVFGSRGAGNFLTKSTAVLATAFFLLSIGTGMYVTRSGVVAQSKEDLGIMEGMEDSAPAVPETPSDVPAAPAPEASVSDAPSDVPAAPAAGTSAEAPAASTAEAPQAEGAETGSEDAPKQ